MKNKKYKCVECGYEYDNKKEAINCANEHFKWDWVRM